jgi:hypothetical protein
MSFLQSKKVVDEFNKFNEAIVAQSRLNLSKVGGKHNSSTNASGALSKSLSSSYEPSKNSFRLTFSMEDYGQFIDEGVKGVDSSAKAPKSEFSYKEGIQNKPSHKHFDKWLLRKGVSGTRNSKGQFIPRKSIAYAVSYGVWRKGIKATHFFTDAFEAKMKDFDKTMFKIIGFEVDKLLTFAKKN